MKEASTKLGGHGGGHAIASGATISGEKEQEFLNLVDEIIGKQIKSWKNMKAFCNIKLEFENQEIVKTVIRSVNVDDFNYIKSNISGKNLEAHIESNSISSLLHTLDDYLACVSIASKVVDKD